MGLLTNELINTIYIMKKLISFILLLLSLSILNACQAQYLVNDAGLVKVDSTYILDTNNYLSDSIFLVKYRYKNDTCSGFFIGYNSNYHPVIKILFNNDINYQINKYDKKGRLLMINTLQSDSVQVQMLYDGKGKLWKQTRLKVNGNLINETMYYANGRVFYDKIYDDFGVLFQERYYYRNGMLKRISIFENGIITQIYSYNHRGVLTP